MRIAIDTGGTFTDCVARIDGRLHVLKLRSTPADPGAAVLEGVLALSAGHTEPVEVRHGTTVGTNAMLERKGARVAFVTTAGFEDTLAIGRQTRPLLYAWSTPPQACLVEPALRFGVPERVTAEGAILRAPTDADLAVLAEAIRASAAEAIAISLLFSFLNPANERRVEAALTPLGLPISTAHRILPEFREYERASTLAVNAYLSPRMQGYLLGLEANVLETCHPERSEGPAVPTLRQDGIPASAVHVMQSSGGIVSARLAAAEPVRTVLSGPAGGVIGAWAMAQAAGQVSDKPAAFSRVIGFDMGGTSTDVFLADADSGGPALTSESIVAGVPVSVPMLDIHTAGAGGGSLARFDAGGLLRVGPESAGSVPGPICFGRGTQPTVTDANLLLGRLDTTQFMSGAVTLDLARTRGLFDTHRGPLPSVEAFAEGILRVVETQMERAIRVISVERGHDPRRFTLIAFGGGGPLHACAVARALRVPTVLIPAHPGALSAVGILLADNVRDYSRTVMLPGTELPNLEALFRELEAQANETNPAALFERSLDLRYRGQGYELNVPFTNLLPQDLTPLTSTDPPSQPAASSEAPADDAAARFHTLHAQRYGFSNPARPLEIVNLRLRVRIPSEPYAPTPAPTTPGDGQKALRGHQQTYFEGQWRTTPIYDRDKLHSGDTLTGPALIAEYTSATVLPPGATLTVDPLHNLIIQVTI